MRIHVPTTWAKFLEHDVGRDLEDCVSEDEEEESRSVLVVRQSGRLFEIITGRVV